MKAVVVRSKRIYGKQRTHRDNQMHNHNQIFQVFSQFQTISTFPSTKVVSNQNTQSLHQRHDRQPVETMAKQVFPCLQKSLHSARNASLFRNSFFERGKHSTQFQYDWKPWSSLRTSCNQQLRKDAVDPPRYHTLQKHFWFPRNVKKITVGHYICRGRCRVKGLLGATKATTIPPIYRTPLCLTTEHKGGKRENPEKKPRSMAKSSLRSWPRR